MPLRDVVLTATVFGLLPVCFLRPWVGMLVWVWLGTMNPHRLTWGFAYDLPFAQMVAVATLAGLLLTKDRKPFLWTRETILLLALWGWFAVTTVFAEHPDWAWAKLVDVSKILLMAALSVKVLQDRHRLRILLFVIAGSIAFFGVKGALFAVSRGGQYIVYGPPGSFIESNNELGLALNMSLPLLFFLAREEPRRWVRRVLRSTFALTVFAIPFTYSRGAVLGLAVVLIVLFLKARWRLLLLPVAIAGLLAFNAFAPDQWASRMETIFSQDLDSSAQRRLTSWIVAFRLAQDHPLTGGGFRVFLDVDTYTRYVPNFPVESGQDAHSLYFNLLGEHGWVGLGLFGALVLSLTASLRRLRGVSARYSSMAWVGNYAEMLQASFVTYLVTGAFISVAYYDLAYQLLFVAVIVKRLAAKEVEAATPQHPAPRPALAPRSTLARGR